ncbi:MAG: GNAT family N-acetyltransferase [Chloroflexi bacterium]|nr:GNAT family N-acetyltransferase [Chloroflexota bacterium]
MEKTDIRRAEKISSVATAALCDGEIIGYSLYTVYIDGAHLARLAVMPRAQGRGIASALLGDALPLRKAEHFYHDREYSGIQHPFTAALRTFWIRSQWI